jgi:hypothetical protein
MQGSMQLGPSLERAAANAKRELLLVAPFIKVQAFEKVLERVDVESLHVVTRWKPIEILRGVSDLEVYELVRDHGGKVSLRQDLHAKYFRADARVFVGSANLTSRGLGWSQNSNLEFSVELDSTNPACVEFETELDRQLVPVDDAYFQLQREQIDAARSFFVPDQIEVSELPLDSLVEARAAGWLPRIRKPDELYTLYKDLHEDLPRSLLQAAQHDLQVLALPAGLDEERFSQLAGVALLATTTFHGIDEFVAVPRRFGEVRQYLTDEHGLASEDAEQTWQTIIRWMRCFLSERYEYSKPGRHTEVITRRF